MAIVKDEKTGKYKIVKSPDSFYQSPSPKSPSPKSPSISNSPSGYEVIRGGQGYSTQKLQQGDIPVKVIGGGGSSGSSSSGSSSNNQSVVTPQQLEQSIASSTAKAQEQKQIQAMREQGESRLRIQAEQQAELQKKRQAISNQLEEMRRRGAIETTRTYTDVKTGDEQVITRTKKGSDTIQQIYNPRTRETRIETYGTGKAGGGVLATGGIVIKELSKGSTDETNYKGGNVFFNTINEAKKEGDKKLNLLRYQSRIPKEKLSLSDRLFGKPNEYTNNRIDTWFENKFKPIPEDEQPFFSPSNVKKVADYTAEKTVRAGEVGNNLFIRSGIIKENSWLNTPLPITREAEKETISNLYLFSAFAPLMRTGTAQTQVQESEYVFDQATQKFIKKADLQAYLSSPEKSGNIVNYNLRYSTKADRINALLRNAKDQESAKKILKIAEESYGKEFVSEFTKQEFGVPVTTQAPKQVQFIKPAQMKNIEFVETPSVYSGTGQYERTNQVQQIQAQQSNYLQNAGQTNWLSRTNFQDSLSGLASVSALTSKSKTRQNNNQISRQISNQISNQISRQISRQDTKQETKQTPRLQQQTDQIFRRLQKRSQREPIKERPKPFIPKPPKPSLARRMLDKVQSSPESFEVFGRRFGKDISLGVFDTKQKAKKKLENFLTGTLGRSGKIKKGKDVLGFEELGFGFQFRKGKKDSGRVVQKAKFSLGSGSERSEIQYFKRKAGKKSKGLFG